MSILLRGVKYVHSKPFRVVFSFTRMSHNTSTQIPPRFVPSRVMDLVEDAEDYRPGGLHTISLGDSLAKGRYTVLHKLGYGCYSTVWLARDHGGTRPGRLVAIKALRADVSNTSNTELAIYEVIRTARSPISGVQTLEHHFFEDGPNGTHLFLVSPFASPNVSMMSFSAGRIPGSKRLRADLARNVSKQLVMAVDSLHREGIVHGDINTANVLFRLKPNIHYWTNSEVYSILGKPKTELVQTLDGTSLAPGVPSMLVQTVNNTPFIISSFLEEEIILADFGQSYIANSPPKDYMPAALLHYFSPEARFEGTASFEADVWALGCAIFEIRTGSPLFSSFMNDRAEVIMNTVVTLGRLPDPWWVQFEKRSRWFHDDGEPKSIQDQRENGVGVITAEKTSLRQELRSINRLDMPQSFKGGPMIEKRGVGISDDEVDLLGDLLEKMLKYRPEDRIGFHEVLQHPWMAM